MNQENLTIKDIIESLYNDSKQDSISNEDKQKYGYRILSVYEANKVTFHSEIATAFLIIKDPDIFYDIITILSSIREYYKYFDPPQGKQNILNAIDRFFECFSLEYAHQIEYLRHQVQIENVLYQNIEDSKQQIINDAQISIESIFVKEKETLEKDNMSFKQNMDEQLRSLNTHSISVLGIFTAVTFVFSGGFTMLGSALSGIRSIEFSTSFLLIAALCIVGIVLLDSVFLMMYYVSRFLDKPIEAKNSIIIICNFALIIWACIMLFLYWIHSHNIQVLRDSFTATLESM